MKAPRPFTYRYAQPTDYHFCQDSVIFPKFVAERLAAAGVAIGADYRTLDVCAGCGVIGLELAFHLPQIPSIDFLELQSEFREAFFHNRALAGRGEDFRFVEANYDRLLDRDYAGQYDLIVANPPYFLASEGRLSPSRLQNHCRFFLDGDPPTLLKGVARALKPAGRAYLLMKSGERHGRSALRDATLSLAGEASLEIVGEIRGTSVVELRPV